MGRLQALYFLSSFFGQFGPNATTWLLPGEVFPTPIRATCHGISAATGKVGALVAGIWFAYLTNAGKFYVAAFFNLVRSFPLLAPLSPALLVLSLSVSAGRCHAPLCCCCSMSERLAFSPTISL